MNSLLINPDRKTPVADTTPLWLQPLYKFGVPSFIAMYLVYALVNGGLTLLAHIDNSLRQHMADTAVQTEYLKDAKESAVRQEGYLRLICVGISKTTAQANSCLSLR